MPNYDKELDTSGLTCPMPVMKCKKALQSLSGGQVLHLLATDPGTLADIPALIKKLGGEILESGEQEGKIHFYIKKA